MTANHPRRAADGSAAPRHFRVLEIGTGQPSPNAVARNGAGLLGEFQRQVHDSWWQRQKNPSACRPPKLSRFDVQDDADGSRLLDRQIAKEDGLGW